MGQQIPLILLSDLLCGCVYAIRAFLPKLEWIHRVLAGTAVSFLFFVSVERFVPHRFAERIQIVNASSQESFAFPLLSSVFTVLREARNHARTIRLFLPPDLEDNSQPPAGEVFVVVLLSAYIHSNSRATF